jgi:hypothetical protein
MQFEAQRVEKHKGGSANIVLIKPAPNLMSEDERIEGESTFFQFMCGMDIAWTDGGKAQGSGQLIITNKRFIGMIDSGEANGKQLAIGATGQTFCFMFPKRDVSEPEVKKRRLKPSEYTFRSNTSVESAFRLTVFGAYGFVKNNKIGICHDEHIVRALSKS